MTIYLKSLYIFAVFITLTLTSSLAQVSAQAGMKGNMQEALMKAWKAECTGFSGWKNSRKDSASKNQCLTLKARLDALGQNTEAMSALSQVAPCNQVEAKKVAQQAIGALKSIQGYTGTSILEMVACIQKQTPKWKASCEATRKKCKETACLSMDFNASSEVQLDSETQCRIQNSLSKISQPIQVRAGQDCDDFLIALPDSKIAAGADKSFHRVYQLKTWKDLALGMAEANLLRNDGESDAAFESRRKAYLEAMVEPSKEYRAREAKNIRKLMETGRFNKGPRTGIVPTLYVDETQILQERFVDGSLKGWIQKRLSKQTEEETKSGENRNRALLALKLGADLSAGLELIHEKKLVHGDIKPDNALADEKGKRAVYTDLGSSYDEQDCLANNGRAISGGTYGYRVPTNAAKAAETDCKNAVKLGQQNDVGAHALVIYGLKYGHEPFWIAEEKRVAEQQREAVEKLSQASLSKKKQAVKNQPIKEVKSRCATEGKGENFHVNDECLEQLRREMVTANVEGRKPDELDILIVRSLNRDASKRPTAAEFRREYDRYLKKAIRREKEASALRPFVGAFVNTAPYRVKLPGKVFATDCESVLLNPLADENAPNRYSCRHFDRKEGWITDGFPAQALRGAKRLPRKPN